MMWFVLATKMAVTALFVTAATIIAERLGATVGALVATLPVSAGPVYVFLALDHDSTFISSSAVASLALNSATAIYLTAYVLIAQRRSMWLSISLAFVMWLGGSTPSTKQPQFWDGGTHAWATPKDLSGLSVPVLLETERQITDAGLSQIGSGLLPMAGARLHRRSDPELGAALRHPSRAEGPPALAI